MSGSGSFNYMAGRTARSGAMVGAVRAGDIMIKYSDGSLVSKVIRFGQLFGRGSSKFVHAGIASASTKIIEMDGHGLQEHNLLMENARYNYDVFRCRYPSVAAGAAETARMMLAGFQEYQRSASGMRISYSLKGAFRSISKSAGWDGNDVINGTLESLLSADGSAFFCSGHVVLCYQSSMGQHQIQGIMPIQDSRQIFSLKSTCYQPAYLHKALSANNHFTFVGKVCGAVLA